MLNFRYAEISDKEWIDDVFKNSGYIGADFCFGSLYLWQDVYRCKICEKGDFLYRIYEGKETYYAFPIGNGDYKIAIEMLIEDSVIRNIPFQMFGITEDMKKIISSIMPNKFRFEFKRNMSDYIYDSNNLSFLKGKKYHSKRNHVSKFKKNYNWEYKDIDINSLDNVRAFFDKWFLLNSDKNIESEKIAVKKALDNFVELGLSGGYIEVDGQIVALTIGEPINNEAFDIHFEKALLNYSGSYPTINQEFAKRNLSNYKYINREEDMGIEGLRKSKLSYHPVFLLDRYNAYLENKHGI